VYARLGLNPTVAADRTIITGLISAPAATSRGLGKPYANYPDAGTVIQSLKPFPQYNGVGATWAPLGNTWYDALQVKATKRYSQGLDATLSYAFSKNLTNIGSATGNVFDRSTFKGLSPDDRRHLLTDQPQLHGAAVRFRQEPPRYAAAALGLDDRLGAAVSERPTARVAPVPTTASGPTIPARAAGSSASPASRCTRRTSTAAASDRMWKQS
jgi:hypothetical protein